MATALALVTGAGEEAELTLKGVVGKVAGSWILPTIHFSTRFMNFGADILAVLPSTSQAYVVL